MSKLRFDSSLARLRANLRINGARSTLVGVLAWTALIVASAAALYQDHRADAIIHAGVAARAYIDKDLAVRRWITGHGGVYVKPSERTPPNPWLKVPQRDVTTTGGMELTLVNPAYATRELQEDFAAQFGIAGHLTGLQLKNPNNAPDEWEAASLQRLQSGAPLVQEVVPYKGGQALRLMRPVFMEKGCLACHADLHIPVGGLRGGISSQVPLGPYLANQQDAINRMLMTHSVIWLVGVVGLGWQSRRAWERHNAQKRALLLANKDDRRIAEVLSISERMETLDEREIIQEALEAGARLTDSKIGYFHLVNEDKNSIELVAWTKSTLESYCRAAFDKHYPIAQAGIWADCARLHQPVIHNDYENLAIKKGLPDGHAALMRHMSVPVMEAGAVRVIFGVGNKEAPYDEHDVRLLQLLANDIWKVLQRKRTATHLRDSEKRLREAQRVAAMGSWALDHSDGSLIWSEQMYALFGVSAASFKPTLTAVAEFFQLDESPPWEAAFRTAIEQKKEFNRVQRILRPDGNGRSLHFRAVTEYLPDGNPGLTTGTAQDITEQQEIEKLKQSKADLHALFEYTDRLIWSVDSRLKLVVANSPCLEAMRRIAGRPVAENEQMPLPGHQPDEAEAWRNYYRRALSGERFSANMEMHIAGYDARWVEFSFFPIWDEYTGQPAGVTVSGYDYTERRRLEESQKQALAQNEQVLRKLELHHHRSLNINRLNDLLQSCRTEAEAFDVISLVLGDMFKGQVGNLAILTPSGRELQKVCAWGERPAMGAQLFGLDDCWALRRGEVHEVRQIGQLECAHFTAVPEHGHICVPLMVRGETLGLLTLEFPPGFDASTAADIGEAARTVAETIKLALSNLRLRVALEEQATHDTLTGLFNRRYLDSTLPRELHRIERSQGHLALAMLDIDHFKKFNDLYGHEAGDLVLKHVGGVLIENSRKSDIACRYGGEELVLILPDVDTTVARERLETICQAIKHLSLSFQGKLLPGVAVSVGICLAEGNKLEAGQILRHADEALYQAKENGRDRIVVFADG